MARSDDLRTPADARALSRRGLLRRAGLGLATAAVLGTGVVGYRAYDQGVLEAGDGPAYVPWKNWDEGDRRHRLVRAAVLAPSPHNSQAWLFALGRRHIDVYADQSRRIPAMDPFDRELHIGVGAAIENLVQAARAEGWAPTVDLAPTTDRSHLARITLVEAPARRSALYAQIPRRHTNRYPYTSDRVVPREALDTMAALALPDVRVVWITQPAARDAYGELIVAATQEIINDPAQRTEDHEWFRHRWDDIQRRRDGITLDAAGLPALATTIAKLLPAQSPTALGEAWLDATEHRHTATAAAYGVVVVDDASDVTARIRGGRTLQRIHLWTSAAGLGLHHMNQVTERADRENQLGSTGPFSAALADTMPPGTQALCSFRIGQPTRPARPSPRRSADEVMLR